MNYHERKMKIAQELASNWWECSEYCQFIFLQKADKMLKNNERMYLENYPEKSRIIINRLVDEYYK